MSIGPMEVDDRSEQWNARVWERARTIQYFSLEPKLAWKVGIHMIREVRHDKGCIYHSA